MTPLRTLILAVLTFSLILPGFFSGSAWSASATLRVTATIRPWIQLSAQQHRTFYKVTAADIRRGYIDLPDALSVRLRTNIRKQIQLELINEGPETILVSEADSSSFQPASGGLSVSAPFPGTPIRRDLSVRVVLSQDTPEGLHPLAISLSPQAF